MNTALEIAITKASQERYDDALKFARKAQRMNPALSGIKKLVASMKILSASPDTTHYQLLRVEETDDATTIRSAYRKLAIDVHPDQNTFPKSSEAFKRIVLAMTVLCDEQSRAKYDHNLAARKPDFYDPSSGRWFYTHSFSSDSSSTDTSSTATSSTTSSSTDTSSTDDVGPGSKCASDASSTDNDGPASKRVSDAQSTSTLHTPKKRREH